MKEPAIETIIGGIGRMADDLSAKEEEWTKFRLEDRRESRALLEKQIEINRIEADHKSIFVAGWRPFIGWIGGVALAYQFVFYPILTWAWAFAQAKGSISSEVSPPALLDTQALWVVVTGMLGIAGMRSFDKLKGTQTDEINPRPRTPGS